MRRYEFVHLTLGDSQQICDIRDDERVPPAVETIRETGGLVVQVPRYVSIGILLKVPWSLTMAVKNIARRLGDDISESNPILDSRLPDGSRVAAVLPPCSIHGVALTIRKFNSHKFTMQDLIKAQGL